MTFLVELTVEVPTVYWEDLGTFGLAITAHVPTVDVRCAGQIAFTAPSPELAVGITSVPFSISLQSPSPEAALSGNDLVPWSLALTVPYPAPALHSYTESHGSIAITALVPSLGINGYSGSILSVAFTAVVPSPAWSGIPSVLTWGIALTAVVPSLSLHYLRDAGEYERRAIVMNTFNNAVSHYENFPFNSVAYFNDTLIAANDSGIFLIGGDDDIGTDINSEITMGLTDKDYQAVRAALEAWITYRSNGELELTVRVDERDDPYAYTFNYFPSRREARAKPGKGIKGRFVTFGIRNKSGATFDIQSFRILGDVKRLKTR